MEGRGGAASISEAESTAPLRAEVARGNGRVPSLPSTSIADALGEDLSDFAAGVEDRPTPSASPSSTPAASLSAHQISEKHAKSPVTVPHVTEPASVMEAPKTSKEAVSLVVVPSATSDVNAGASGSVAGAVAGVITASTAPAACGPFGRPCFFCNGPTPMKDRWVLLPGPVSSDLPEIFTNVLTAAEGLHPCFLNQHGARSVLIAGKYLGIKPSECEDVCGKCGERESADEKIEPMEDPAFAQSADEPEEGAEPARDPKVDPVKGDVIHDPGDWVITVSEVEARSGGRGPLVLFTKRLERETEDMAMADSFGVSLGGWRARWKKPRDEAGISTADNVTGPGVPEKTPPFGNPRVRVPFTREIAVESLGPSLSETLLADLVACPEDETLGNGSLVFSVAERVHGIELANRLWEEAGGKWSKPGRMKAAVKRLGMKGGQWRRFVMSLPVKFNGNEKPAAQVVAEICASIPGVPGGGTL